MFAIRIGRNEVFNHAGNVATALLAGIVGYLMGQVWIFYLVAIIGVASVVSVLFIRDNDIDYLRSRGGALNVTPDGEVALGIRALFSDRKILIFAVTVTLFHFANAAMLLLAGQLLTRDNEIFASLNMSACIVAAQGTG